MTNLASRLCLAAALALCGCRSNPSAAVVYPADSAVQAAELPQSSAIQIHPIAKSRMPRTCGFVASPPDNAMAAVLLQCTMEAAFRDSTSLLQNVSVQVGSPQPLDESVSRVVEHIDNRQPMYALVANATSVLCIDASIAPGTNCTENYYRNAPGWCYKTTDRGWRCSIPGMYDRSVFKAGQPPPTTY